MDEIHARLRQAPAVNAINELPPIDYGDLIEKWGGRRVEDTMIYIEGAKDHRGLLVSIPCTQERVEAVLKAVYGEYE